MGAMRLTGERFIAPKGALLHDQWRRTSTTVTLSEPPPSSAAATSAVDAFLRAAFACAPAPARCRGRRLPRSGRRCTAAAACPGSSSPDRVSTLRCLRIGHAQCLGHHVAVRMGARLVDGDRALRDQFLHVAVVLRQLGQVAVAPQVDAAVADPGHLEAVAGDAHGDHGRAHRQGVVALARGADDLLVGDPDRLRPAACPRGSRARSLRAPGRWRLRRIRARPCRRPPATGPARCRRNTCPRSARAAGRHGSGVRIRSWATRRAGMGRNGSCSGQRGYGAEQDAGAICGENRNAAMTLAWRPDIRGSLEPGQAYTVRSGSWSQEPGSKSGLAQATRGWLVPDASPPDTQNAPCGALGVSGGEGGIRTLGAL